MLISVFKTSGHSMEPTLKNGERLLVERVSPRFNKLKRGDVVIFNPPGNNSIDYVKRIVGLPGETLKIVDCKVYLGGTETISEPYLNKDECTKGNTDELISIPTDAFYVLGDNRSQSADSRIFGPLAKDRIGGKVMARFWPFSKMTFFN